jgi:MFS family permease
VDLEIPEAARTWPSSAFSLTVASFLLVFGRLADIYGGYPTYLVGVVWLAVWSFIAGFSTNELMLNTCRGLQGLGPAAFLPSGVMLLGSIYRPGPRKNLVFSIYGACAPTGFFVGIFFAGLTGEYTTWGWYFWIGTILSAITAVIAYLTVPSDIHERRALGVKMDWPGAILIISGLIIFTAAVIDSSHAPQGWKSPHIIVLFIVGTILLVSAGYVECCVATNPLLPPSLFRVPHMTPLITALFLTYGSLGIFLVYVTFYMTDILGASPLLVVAWYVPMCFGGCIIGTFGGFVLHLLPGTLLIIIAGTSWIVAPLLFAIAPDHASYWAYIFPSMVCATVGIDITFNITNIFVTTSLPRKQQGLAGAVTMLLLHLSMALYLGFADIVNMSMLPALGERNSYRAVFWLEVACGVSALLILVAFVKIKKAESAMTADELQELEMEESS